MGGSSWIDALLEILCKIYQAMGGDCSDFEGDPHKAVTVVCGAYSTWGAPKFNNPGDLSDFLSLLGELETQLALPGNTLSGSDNAALATLIANLRKDLA